MELTHNFTVPASVDDAWATFMDLERVGSLDNIQDQITRR